MSWKRPNWKAKGRAWPSEDWKRSSSSQHWSYAAAERGFQRNDPGWSGWAEPKQHVVTHTEYGKRKCEGSGSSSPERGRNTEESTLPPRHFLADESLEAICSYRETTGLRVGQHYPEKFTRVLLGRPVQAPPRFFPSEP